MRVAKGSPRAFAAPIARLLGIEDDIEAVASLLVASETVLLIRATLLAMADRK